MRILYLSSSYLPSRRASSIQVMEMCRAFAEQGHEVTLVGKSASEDVAQYANIPHTFYGISSIFDVVRFQRPVKKGGGLVYEIAVVKLLYRERGIWDLVYSRDLIGAWLATLVGLPVVFEAHEILNGRIARFLYRKLCSSRRLLRIVSITEALRGDLGALGFLPCFGDTLVAPSAVNPNKIRAVSGKLDHHRYGTGPQVGYIGNLYVGRGVEVILELANRLPEMTFHIVGGDEENLARIRTHDLAPNVVLHGFVRPDLIGNYYNIFDMLVLPHQDRVLGASGTTDIARWCSPMKLFEYMAAGKAIIASDLPVLREILRDGENALIVAGNDIDAWENALRRIASDEEMRLRLGGAAHAECVTKYTWAVRAGSVLTDLGVRINEPTEAEVVSCARPAVRTGVR